MKNLLRLATITLAVVLAVGVAGASSTLPPTPQGTGPDLAGFDNEINQNSRQLLTEGRQVFRFDTFGDEAFWGDTLQLHKAIEGTKFGGVGPGVSPKTALAVGLKVDVDALPAQLVQGWSARVTGGATVGMADGARLSLGGELGGLGSGQFSNWSVRGRASVPF